MGDKAKQDKIGASFARKVFAILPLRGALLLINLLASVLIARTLGPEGRGLFSLASTLTAVFVQFGNFGYIAPNTYYLAKHPKALPLVMGNSGVLSIFIGLTALLGLCAFWLFPTITPLGGALLALSVCLAPVQLYAMFQTNMCIALNELRLYSLIEFLTAALFPAIFLYAIFRGYASPTMAFGINVLALVAITLGGFLFLYQRYRALPRFSWSFMKRCAGIGFKSYVCMFLSYLILRVDIFMINHYLGEAQTGLYSTASSLVDMINIIYATIGMLLYPAAVRISNSSQRHAFMASVMQKVMLLMLIALGLAFILAQLLIPLLYGQAFEPSVAVFQILLPGMYFWGAGSLLANYFASQKTYLSPLLSYSGALCANIILNLLLIPSMGIKGAALASTITYLGSFVILSLSFHEK